MPSTWARITSLATSSGHRVLAFVPTVVLPNPFPAHIPFKGMSAHSALTALALNITRRLGPRDMGVPIGPANVNVKRANSRARGAVLMPSLAPSDVPGRDRGYRPRGLGPMGPQGGRQTTLYLLSGVPSGVKPQIKHNFTPDSPTRGLARWFVTPFQFSSICHEKLRKVPK